MVDVRIPQPQARPRQEHLYPWWAAIAIAALWFVIGFFIWWAWQAPRLYTERNNPTAYSTLADWTEELDLCIGGALTFVAFWCFVGGALLISELEISRTALWIGGLIIAGMYAKFFYDFLHRD